MPTRKKKELRSEGRSSSETFKKIKNLETEIAVVIGELEQTLWRVECLGRFASLVAADVSAEVLVRGAQEAACQLLQCESTSILLVDPKTGVLPDPFTLGAGARSSLQVPLRMGQSIFGIIQVLNKVPSISSGTRHRDSAHFDEKDSRLLEELSKSLSVGLQNARLKSRLQKSFHETVEVLTEAVTKKDRYTGGHTKRVAYYASLIAKYMDLTPEQSEMVRCAALLHDVGKIGIEDKILKKEGPLNDAEWLVMKTHPELGHEILSRMDGWRSAVDGAYCHHERWDGKGYPAGLKGEEIPLTARIVALADAYDAMVSNRPYRQGIAPEVAYEEIVRQKGTQFDPRVVDAFVSAYLHEKMGKGPSGRKAEPT